MEESLSRLKEQNSVLKSGELSFHEEAGNPSPSEIVRRAQQRYSDVVLASTDPLAYEATITHKPNEKNHFLDDTAEIPEIESSSHDAESAT